MRYYATASGPRVAEAIDAGLLGMIASPAAGNLVRPGWHWCADNNCYTGRYPGDQAYLRWLHRHTVHVDRCAFATAPDVVADAAATLARSVPILGPIRALGYPAALVFQDGIEHLPIPWDEFDVAFLGGSTTWKLGPAASDLAAEARRRGTPVHLGRVNSLRRLHHAARIGATSVDGTLLAFGPDRHLPRLLRWLQQIQPSPTGATAPAASDGPL
mgnify:CR=1 FL=1